VACTADIRRDTRGRSQGDPVRITDNAVKIESWCFPHPHVERYCYASLLRR
jgi:hypothetical protein